GPPNVVGHLDDFCWRSCVIDSTHKDPVTGGRVFYRSVCNSRVVRCPRGRQSIVGSKEPPPFVTLEVVDPDVVCNVSHLDSDPLSIRRQIQYTVHTLGSFQKLHASFPIHQCKLAGCALTSWNVRQQPCR